MRSGKIGEKVVVREAGRLNRKGHLNLKVRDRNGNGPIQYMATIKATSRTQRDVTNVAKVR